MPMYILVVQGFPFFIVSTNGNDDSSPVRWRRVEYMDGVVYEKKRGLDVTGIQYGQLVVS